MSLSAKQIRQLGIVSSAAVAHQRAIGALTLASLPADMRTASKSAQNEFWRHQQVALATQRVCSFKDMVNDEYRPTMQHFEALAGDAYKARAVNSTVRVVEDAACHRVPGCEYVRDMYVWMKDAGFSEGYRVHIAKAKFGGITDLRMLSTHQLKQLHDTIVNNARKKLELGDDADRRKKERAKRAGLPVEPMKHTETPSLPSLPVPGVNGSPPASKSRTYILKPRPAQRVHSTASQPRNPDIEPF